MKRSVSVLVPLLAGWATSTLSAPSDSSSSATLTVSEKPTESYTFVGVKKCKMCHRKKATGDQYGIWSESLHAKAYETLAGDKAREAAAERGIENPQEAPECLKCHVTAFPVMDDLENQKITLEEGVSCESCHGPGSGYYKRATMKALTAGEIEPESVGLVMPPPEERCLECHNEESPFYKEFDYEAFKAKIAHPRPRG